MVDEFQDTNRLQLDVLEALERDNLFAVGDEFQSIYGFRARRRGRSSASGAPRSAPRRVRTPARELPLRRGAARRPRRGVRPGLRRALRARSWPGAGRRPPTRTASCGCSTPTRRRASRRSSCCSPTPRAGRTPSDDARARGARRAAAGAAPRRGCVAHRLREEVDAGRRPGDIVVLVRATASLRLFEQALEEQGLPTYVVGGRGYWSAGAGPRRPRLPRRARQPARRGRAATACSPRRSAASAPTRSCCSPRRAARAGAGRGPRLRAAPRRRRRRPAARLARRARRRRPRAARRRFAAVFAAERERAERAPVEVLLERAVAAHGLRPGDPRAGRRRAADGEPAQADAPRARVRARRGPRPARASSPTPRRRTSTQAREGEAPLESEGLDAVRLMTIHRAKGLEFAVVCVADLGRAARRAGASAADRPRRRAWGCGCSRSAAATAVPALAYERLAAELDGRGGRGGAAPALRGDDPRPRAADPLRRRATPAPGRRPARRRADRLDRPRAARRARRRAGGRGAGAHRRAPLGRPHRARCGCALNARATLGAVAAPRPRSRPAAAPPRGARRGPRCPPSPRVLPARRPAPRPAPQRLSYSSLQALRPLPVPLLPPAGPRACPTTRSRAGRAPGGRGAPRPPGSTRGCAARSPSSCSRTSTSPAPARPRPRRSRRWPPSAGRRARRRRGRGHPRRRRRVRRLAAARPRSPPRATSAARRRSPSRSTTGARGRCWSGSLDVLAAEADGAALVVDYKTDRLEGAEPADVVDAGYATQRAVYALAALRGGRAARRGRVLLPRAPGEPVDRELRPRRRARAGRRRARARARGARRGVSGHRRGPTATCAGTARAGARCAPMTSR